MCLVLKQSTNPFGTCYSELTICVSFSFSLLSFELVFEQTTEHYPIQALKHTIKRSATLASISKEETNEPRREKTGNRGFRPGPTQTVLYKLRKELEA